MDAVADFSGRVGKFVRRFQSAINGLPSLARVVGAKRAGGRDSNEDALRIHGIKHDGVQAHSSGAGLPKVAFRVAERGEFLPILAAVGGAEHGGVFHSSVDGIGIFQGWFEMPNAFEFPGVLRAVIPFMSSGISLVDKFVADWLPGFSAVVRALN